MSFLSILIIKKLLPNYSLTLPYRRQKLLPVKVTRGLAGNAGSGRGGFVWTSPAA